MREKIQSILKRGWLLFSIVNSIFFAFQIASFSLFKNPSLEWNPGFCLIIFSASIIPGIGSGILISWLLSKRKDIEEEAVFAKYEDGWLVEGYRSLGTPVKKRIPSSFLAWIIIFVSYIPGLLAYYPGICSYDAYIQLEQCISGEWNGHHPILHTLLLNLFWQFGKYGIGDVNIGIFMFVLLQMLCLSGAFAYSIHIMKKLRCSLGWCVGCLLFAVLFPYNMFISLSVTKAGLFTAAFLPMTVLALYFFTKKRESMMPEREDIAYVLLLIPAVAFRNNAKYAIIVYMAVVLVTAIVLLIKKNYRFVLYFRVFVSTLAGLVIALVLIAAVNKLMDVTQGDRREMLSIPIQQLARTAYEHNAELEPRDMEVIDSFILNEAWRSYDPLISDPVKRHVNTWYALHYPKKTLGTYLRLLWRYPDEYINAFLVQNAGYLYIFDRSCLDVYGSGNDGRGFVQTAWAGAMTEYGVSKHPVIPFFFEALEKINYENLIQKIPVLGHLFLPGYVLWFFVFITVVFWYRKKYHLIPVSVMVLAFIGTLLLGPTVQMRYIYPVWVMLPFFLAVVYGRKGNNQSHG